MRKKGMKRYWIAFLLVLVTAASLMALTTAAEGSRKAELTAVFDKAAYAAGERVTVTFTMYGADFDAAGFHIEYDQSGLTYSDVQVSSGFTAPVCRAQEGTLELLVQSEAVQKPGSSGVPIATVTFTAGTAGAKTLRFEAGSAAYLESRSAVAYNGYQALDVATRVVEDLAAYNALAAAKADAIAELEAYVEGAMTKTTVAGQDMLRTALQNGMENISNVKTEKKVQSALKNAKKRVDTIVGYGEIHYPKMQALYDGNVTGTTDPVTDIYPVFDPETTVYFFYQSRTVKWAPRIITCVVDENVDVSVDENSALSRPRNESTFYVTLDYVPKNNCHWIKLTDRVTGLSTTYTFYTFNYGTTALLSNLNVYKQGQETTPLGNMEQSGQLYRVSTDEAAVKIGFRVGIGANKEFSAQLLDESGTVLQTFTAAAGDDGGSRTFLSDTIQLKPGDNWVMLRQDTGSDYSARVIVIRYVTPEDYEKDPALKDTTLEAVSLYYADGDSSKGEEGTKEIPIDFTFDPEVRKSTVTLSMDDFDTEKSIQEIRMRITPRSGQTVTVYGGNEIAQARKLLEGGYYHLADYYNTKMMAKDRFSIIISVTAADGIHRDLYEITVDKPGRPGIVVPKVYQVREALITASKPIRDWNLVFNSVGITDQNGNLISTERAAKEGHLWIEIADPTIVSWDGKSLSGGTFRVDLLKQGVTEITLVYDDNAGSHLEAKTTFYLNYSADMIREVLKDADQIISDEELGVRVYEPGATDDLKKVMIDSRSTYSLYVNRLRDDMTQKQFDEINAAVNNLLAAIQECRWRELGIKIIAFDPLPEDEIPQEVEHNALPGAIGPKTLGATTADGEHITIYGVTWAYTPEFASPVYENKTHVFTARLPSGYALARGTTLPSFTVLRKATPWMVYLTKNYVLFPEACTDFNRTKTTATLKVYPGTTLEEIFNQWNRNGAESDTGLGLQTYTRAPYRTSLPTQWLEVPNNFSSTIVGRSFTFKFTLQEGGSNVGINYKWNENVPEDQKVYTMTVKIVPAPTVTVEGLDGVDIEKITVSGTKTDTVFGTAKESDLTPFSIQKSDGWTYKLTDRGEKLVPLKYNFVPQEIEGYEAKVTQPNGKDYVITYVKTAPTEIHLDPAVLTMSIGDEAKTSLVEILPDDAKYQWISGDESIASVTPVDLQKGGKITALDAGTTDITLEVTLHGETLRATCAVTVLSGSGGNPGGGDTPGGGDNPGGSGDVPSGGTGSLSGQATGSSDYEDLLDRPQQSADQAGTATGTGTSADKSQGTKKPEAGSTGSGNGSKGNGTTNRVISVAKGDGDSESTPASDKDLAIILAACAVLLAGGMLRGKKRGED